MECLSVRHTLVKNIYQFLKYAASIQFITEGIHFLFVLRETWGARFVGETLENNEYIICIVQATPYMYVFTFTKIGYI